MEATAKKPSSHWKGSIIGDFNVVSKLGEGGFSTVWLAVNKAGEPVAVKVFRSNNESSRSYKNEVKIFNKIASYSHDTNTLPEHIISYHGTFAHVSVNDDSSPVIYPCMVFSAMPASLSRLMKDCDKKYNKGFPISMVKVVMRQIFIGLVYLHQCGIIHGDIKPSNILANMTLEELDLNPGAIKIFIADLGCSSQIDDIYSRRVGTTNYQAPELIIKSADFDYSMDIWSAFVTCFEILTNDYLFDVYSECDIEYGEDVDNEILEVEVGPVTEDYDHSEELNVEDEESQSNDSSGSLADEFNETDVKYRHLLLIAKVIGYPPKSFTENAREYYNRHDRLMRNPDIKPTLIRDLLAENYEMSQSDCLSIEEFLLAGLKYLPEERVTAIQALKLPWLLCH